MNGRLGRFGLAVLAWGAAWAALAPAAETPATAGASLAELKALESQVRKVVEQVRPAVVRVSGGSGVVVDAEGLIMSVAHVGNRAGRQVTVAFPDGRKAKAVTLGNDASGDAGLMKITDPGPWPFAEVAPSADVKLGQWCVALSYPVSFGRGHQPMVRLGRVHHNCPLHLFTDCTIMGGDSGGPLFDLQGRVIAISSRCERSTLMNVHVAADRFRENWDRLLQGEDLDPKQDDRRGERVAFLGVSPDAEAGVARVGSVIPGSPADKAGLQAGDLLLRVGDREVREYTDVPPLIRARKPGDKLELQVRRGEQDLKLKVTLGTAND